ncbi:MAG: nitrogenase component 1 [Bacillota bacterium]|nr:nitrogenase component 1 [Bacillota bacterium]
MSSVIEQPRYSCALGAQQTVLAIPGAIPILHSGPGCTQKIHGALVTSSGHQGEGYAGGSHIPCTNSAEKEVVFGGEKRLSETIDGSLKVMKGDLFVVLTGCTSEIVGDDVQAVTLKYRKKGYPIINAETGGFKGTNYFGHEMVIQAIIKQFIGDAQPKVKKGLVNVFSVVPFQNQYWRGDLQEIKHLLNSIGLEVNILFGYESAGITEWKDIPNAEFNLILSPWLGLETAELLKNKYNTPYLHYPVIPVGAEATSKFLRKVGEFANVDKEKIESVISKEEKRFYKYFVGAADFFTEVKNGLPYELYTIADSTYALGASNFLINELGYVPKQAFITDNVPEKYTNKIKYEFEKIDEEYKDKVTFEIDGGKIEKKIRNDENTPRKTLILGSEWEDDLSFDIKAPLAYLSIPNTNNLILNKTYVGYNGGLRLIEDIYSIILSDRFFNERFVDREEKEIGDYC